MVKQLTEEGLFPVSRISPSRSHSPISEMGKSRSPVRGRVALTNPSVDELEDSSCKLNPKVEGRVLEMTPEVDKSQDNLLNYIEFVIRENWNGDLNIYYFPFYEMEKHYPISICFNILKGT